MYAKLLLMKMAILMLKQIILMFLLTSVTAQIMPAPFTMKQEVYGAEEFLKENEMKIKIKYIKDEYGRVKILPIDKISIGDWIDLRSAEDVDLIKGEFRIIHLGVAMKLPEGYEAHIAPRSSTFKKWGIIQANGVGVVDESYCGDNDEWGIPVVAMKDTHIHKNDRICQFRIEKKMPKVSLIEVDRLDNPDRGGFGSTGEN